MMGGSPSFKEQRLYIYLYQLYRKRYSGNYFHLCRFVDVMKDWFHIVDDSADINRMSGMWLNYREMLDEQMDSGVLEKRPVATGASSWSGYSKRMFGFP
jgi:hypothetical protein